MVIDNALYLNFANIRSLNLITTVRSLINIYALKCLQYILIENINDFSHNYFTIYYAFKHLYRVWLNNDTPMTYDWNTNNSGRDKI